MKTLFRQFAVTCFASAFVLINGGMVHAALPGGTLVPTNIPKYVTPLVIPPVMPSVGVSTIGSPGTENYDIAVRQFKQQILPGGIWNTVGGYAPGTYTYPSTSVWSYGSALDPLPDSSGVAGGGAGVAPAPNSSFNYPAFTIENTANQMNKVRWINQLVQDPIHCDLSTVPPTPANGFPTACNYLPHLLPVDQTLHWANPPKAGCLPHGMMTDPMRTDCETLTQGPYTGPVPIVTHLHGAHVNPQSDGYPEAWWLPNADNIDASYATGGTRYGEWTNDGANTVPGSAFFAYENTQEAATLWYHDHSMGMTRLNVYAGPAGFWLIRGGANDTDPGDLPGPAPVAGDSLLDLNAPTSVVASSIRNNIREIPIVIQDRSFDWVDADGTPVPEGDPSAAGTKLWYPSSRVDFDGFTGPYLGGADPYADISAIWNPEAFFNTFVVNGVTWPKLDVAQERYRFRLLNGCNSRSVNMSMFQVTAGTDGIFGTSDDVLGAEVPFFQIGGDQGFLPKVTMIQTGFMAQLTPGVEVLPAVTPTPADMQGLLMMPAERADVIVDFTGIANGTHIRIINTADDGPFAGLDPLAVADPLTTGQIMEFVVDASVNKTGGDTSTPVTELVLPPDTALGTATNTRKVSLNEMISDTTCIAVDAVTEEFIKFLYTQPADNFDIEACEHAGMAVGGGITGILAGPRQALLGTVVNDPVAGGLVAVPQRWMDPITQNPLLNSTEIWEIYNTTMDAHPIHVHLVRFEIVEREGLTINPITGVMTPDGPGTITTPRFNELGFKDTVVAYPGQITRLKAKFDIPGLYVWHCHIVEHEDNEMMLPFKVVTTAVPSVLTSPSESTTFSGKSQTFTWNDVGAIKYGLDIGTTVGASNIYTYRGTETTISAANLPTNGSTVYVRLWTNFGPGWVYNDYMFTAVSQSTLITPTVPATFSSSSQIFTWSNVGALNYGFDVGTSVGAKNLYSYRGTATTRTVTNLPTDGSTVYVRLWTNFGPGWVFSDYTFTAVSRAALSAPTMPYTFISPSQTFTWNNVGAINHGLDIGTSVGANNLYSYRGTATTRTVTNLPTDGSTVYVRLWTNFGPGWLFNDYSFTAVSRADLTSPTMPFTFTGSSQTFTWNNVGAINHGLDIGTSVGANNIYSYRGTATTRTVTNLPTDGSTVYVRLWTNFGPGWLFNDYTFTAF